MKNTKVCPKCNSGDIVQINGYIGAHGSNTILVGMTTFSAVNVNRYICCNCGFVEEWIDKENLEKVKNGKHSKKING